jgi:hypothetical protein
VFHKAAEVVDGFPIYDFVPQFYVGRADKVLSVGWDDDLKTLDHFQFAWRARGKLKATVLPYFSSFNTSERNPEYDRYRWKRVRRYQRMQLRKLGPGVRRIEDVWSQENLAELLPQLDQLASQPKEGLSPFPRTLVIGLGSGRSGSFTLSRLLQAQFKHPGSDVIHERKPLLRWKASKEEVWSHLDGPDEPGLSFFGGVALYYLPHVETICGPGGWWFGQPVPNVLARLHYDSSHGGVGERLGCVPAAANRQCHFFGLCYQRRRRTSVDVGHEERNVGRS